MEETIRICHSEGVLTDYLEHQREEVIDMMLSLFDDETIMKNHDAALERKSRQEGEKAGRKEGLRAASDLMNFLWRNGRGEDALRASSDGKLFGTAPCGIPERQADDGMI